MLETQLRSASVRPMLRCKGQIGPEAVGRRQAGPLADQHHHHARAENGADLVAQRDARAGGDHGVADLDVRPAASRGIRWRTSSTAWTLTAAGDRPSPITMASWHGTAHGSPAAAARPASSMRPEVGTPQIIACGRARGCETSIGCKAETARVPRSGPATSKAA